MYNKYGVLVRSKRPQDQNYGTKTERAATRVKVIERDRCMCRKCGISLTGVKDRQVHHIIPLSRGGSNSVANQILLCFNCHKLEHKNHDIRPSKSKRPKITKYR